MTGAQGGPYEPGAPGPRELGPAPSSIAAALAGPPVTAAPPRFAQLTYTSFHRADGVGGRQVKEVSGGLTPEEQQPLVERAVGPATGKLRRFLTADEVDLLPRRLVYGPAPGGAAAYWHSVPAGIDSSGRPGNVFAHIVLDRRPATPAPPLRPSDLLRSRRWLRPFGEEEVLAARLADVPDPPWPDEAHGRAAVLGFLGAHAVVKPGALSGLLDAVLFAMDRGPMVVFGVEDVTSTEGWIAAVCHLMSAGRSRQLYFSTTERAEGLAAARAAALHLVVVPCADLPTIEPDESVVLISDEDLAVDFVEYDEHDEGQEHVTRYGSRIPVTPWSAVAAAVVQAGLTAELLAAADAVAAEAGDEGLPCGWPLAMAVVLRALVQRDETSPDATALDYVVPAAAALIAREKPPPGVRPGTRLHRADRLVRERSLGVTTAEAWAVAGAPRRRGDDRTFATTVYLERALRDPEWLGRPEGVPVPAGTLREVDAEVVTQARAALQAAGAGADDGDPDARVQAAVRALRLLDLTTSTGLVDVRADAAAVAGVLDRHGPLLLDAVTAASLVERVGALTEATQDRVVRPWFDARLPQLPGRPGFRLPALLLRWLFPDPPLPPSTSGLVHAAGQPATLVEAAVAATAVLADPSAFRALAVACLLATPGGELDRLGRGPALAITEVQGLLDAVEPHRLIPVLAPSLRAAPAGPDLDQVVGRVRAAAGRPEWDTPAGHAVQEAAEMRSLETEWAELREGHDRWRTAGRLAALLRPLMAQPAALVPALPDGLVESGMAADVIDRICRATEPDGRPLAALRLPRPVTDDELVMVRVARRVADAVGHGIVNEVDVVLAAQAPDWDMELRMISARWWEDLADVRWTAPRGRPERLLDHVVRLRVRSMWRDRQAALVEDVRQEVHRNVHRRTPHDVRRLMHDYDGAALKWWRMVGVGDDALGALVKRRP